MSLARSNFSIGADDESLIQTALDSAADNIIFDLEDQVALEDKDTALENVQHILRTRRDDDKGYFVRINGLETNRGISDIESVCTPTDSPDALMVPNARSAENIRLVSDVLDSLTVDTDIIPLVESPQAVFDIHRIVRASNRVSGVAFGTADFRLRMGISTQDRDADLHLPRYLVSMAANMADVLPIDAPYIYRNDVDGLRADAERMKRIGYRGKFVAIESQIEPVNDVFTPSKDEIERAKSIVRAFDDQQKGVIYYDDTFIDRPIANEQRRLLRRARRAGLDVDLSDIDLDPT